LFNLKRNSSNGRKNQRKKRQNLNNGEDEFDKAEDSIAEANYNLKSSFLRKTYEKKKTLQLALPIKTSEGRLVKNILEINDEPPMRTEAEANADKIRVNEKNEKAATIAREKEKNEEAPKSLMDLIRDRRNLIEKSKEKIAFLSRQIIENPQEQVLIGSGG
jgi:hypothetical protein